MTRLKQETRVPKILTFQDKLFLSGPVKLKDILPLCINSEIIVGIHEIGSSGFTVASEVLSFIDARRIRRTKNRGTDIIELISRPECNFSLIRNLKATIKEDDFIQLCLSSMGLNESPIKSDIGRKIIADMLESICQTFNVVKIVDKNMRVMYITGNNK